MKIPLADENRLTFMKNILIIYSHWYPSNLAGVHRPRLIGNYLKDFGWQPYVLTVNSKFYEETPDSNMELLFSKDFIEYRVDAFRVTKPRVIGDIGLRAFFQLYKKAIEIIRKENVHFVWIPIPSFYVALLGRLLYEKTKIPYGIDYIDPWVRDISNRRNWRNILSNALARFLEPIAIRKASLITGVSEGYYRPALERNFKLGNTPPHLSFPYGFDPDDYNVEPIDVKLPWSGMQGCKPIVYAGAFLPNAIYFTDILFASIRKLIDENEFDPLIQFFFVGTGNYQHQSITELAKKYGLTNIHEIRTRYPYTHVLSFLKNSFRVLVVGSTEPHYTASKLFQALLSKKPMFAVFHENSTAKEIAREVNADQFFVSYNELMQEKDFHEHLYNKLKSFVRLDAEWSPELTKLEKYSSKECAREFVKLVNEVL